jgi:MoaA/NifB/PqqE/SkfB family radical SAM enzyme
MKQLIESINWIITNRCNSKCKTCDIWCTNETNELSVDEIKKILQSDLIKKSYQHYGEKFDISLGGGEPFLRKDLNEVCNLIESVYPGSLKTISTNGLASEEMIGLLRKTNGKFKFKLNISIDGDQETHDKIRGINGSYKKTLNTIEQIRQLYPKQAIELKLTLTPLNFHTISHVQQLAGNLFCDFSLKPAENMGNYTNKKTSINIDFSDEMISKIKKQLNPIRMREKLRGNNKLYKFYRDMPFYLNNKKKKLIECDIANRSITIMPDGKVYGCILLDSIGDLKKQNIDNIWFSKEADEQRHAISNGRCPNCMLMCGSYKSYTNEKPKKETLNWELTLDCNFNCAMCTQQELKKDGLKEISTEEVKKTIDGLADIGHISFLGGETFLRQDIFDIFHYLDKKMITYEITTNGSLIDKSTTDKLKKCIGLTNIIISLDGMQNTNDAIRGKGAFDRIANSINMLNDYFDICVATIIMDKNIKDIPNLTDFLAGIGVKSQKLIFPVSIPEKDRLASRNIINDIIISGPKNKWNTFSYLDLIKLSRRVKRIAKNHGMKISFEPGLLEGNASAFHKGKIREIGSLSCKQLNGPRLDPMGNQIICEFIRNSDNRKEIASKIKENNLLPMCKWCCKVVKDEDSK